MDVPTVSVSVQQHHLGLILHNIYQNLLANNKRAAADAILSTPFFLDPSCSYTVDKKKIYIKVVDKSTGIMYPTCVLEQVILHELSHVLATTSRGHDSEFERMLHTVIDHRLHDFQACRIPPSYVCVRGAQAPDRDPPEGPVPHDLILHGDMSPGLGAGK